MKTYTTVQGDMWDSIAFRQLGSTDYTDKLIYVFPAGVVLTLPEITQGVNNSLPPWKRG